MTFTSSRMMSRITHLARYLRSFLHGSSRARKRLFDAGIDASLRRRQSSQVFQGYKLEPPIPGVQDNWVTILRFDSNAHLEAWLNSEQRKQILQEADAFSSDTHMRKACVGFESWVAFTGGEQQGSPLWKVHMIVLLGLYPIVFLFSLLVQAQLLIRNGMPFWLALFFGNALSTALLGWFLVPQLSNLFGWWLQPSGRASSLAKQHWITWAGAALILVLYAALLLVFSILH
jgi:antibiotic biosynthesis monooxygenase (ABM) superfamily enzyme